jgi:hypothetical protein
MLAYIRAVNVPEGMLVYCQYDGAAPPTNISVLNLGTRLSTWMPRLDRTSIDIEQELQALAAYITKARPPHPNEFRE